MAKGKALGYCTFLQYTLFAKLQDLGNTQVYNGDPVRGTSELLLSSKCIAVPSLRRLFGLGEPLVPSRGGLVLRAT